MLSEFSKLCELIYETIDEEKCLDQLYDGYCGRTEVTTNELCV